MKTPRFVAATAAALVLAAAPALAQNPTSLPASGSGIRNFGVWLDDASVAEPGGGWASASFGYYRTDLLHEVDAPVGDAGVGVTRRVQFGFSVPVYNISVPGEPTTRGLGDLYLHSKVQLRDPWSSGNGFGYAVIPLVEVLSTQQPVGQHRVNWALPLSMELQRPGWRVYGSTGYFSRGSLFVSGALERTISERLWITGTISDSYSTRADVEPIPGLSRARADVSGGASYMATPTVMIFGSLGRTISAHDVNSATVSLSVGVSVNIAAPPPPKRKRARRH
jgi:hypothetical protein